MIPAHKNPKPRPQLRSALRAAKKEGAFVPSFISGVPTPAEKRERAARLKEANEALDELVTCPAITRDGPDHFLITLAHNTKMSPVLTEIREKSWVFETRSWRCKVDAATGLLPHLDLIREVWEHHLPYRAEDPRSEGAVAEAKEMLDAEWWLLTKSSVKLLEELSQKTVLNTAEVKVIRAIKAKAQGKLLKIGAGFGADDLTDLPDLFGPERIEWMKEACTVLAQLDPDRAKICNGAGFTASDTEKGHYLSQVDEWRLSHAHAAYRMLKKYVRQLPRDLYGRIYA